MSNQGLTSGAQNQKMQLALPDGVLYGALLRPPILQWDGRRYTGAELQGIDRQPALAMPGVVALVVIEHYIGLLASSFVQARQAVELLRPDWKVQSFFKERQASSIGDEACAPPYISRLSHHGAVGDAGAVAWCVGDEVTLWLPCTPEQQQMLRLELASLLSVEPECICIVQTDWSGTGKLHELDLMDAAADAALLSKAVARPVRVALQVLQGGSTLSLTPVSPVAAAPRNEQGKCPSDEAASQVLLATQPWAVRPSMARLLSQPSRAQALDAIVSAGRGWVIQHDRSGTPLAHASAQELLAAQVFAQQSLIDEQAVQLGLPPMEYRLSLPLSRPERRLAEHMMVAMQESPDDHMALTDGRLYGRGYASAQSMVCGADGLKGEVWSAWVAEVMIQPETGQVQVVRVRVGHDSQQLQAAKSAPLEHQETQFLDLARQLLTAPAFDDWATAVAGDESSEGLREHSDRLPVSAASDAIAHGQLSVDGVLTLPAAAAIANAIFDATGVRLRELPLNGEQLRCKLQSVSIPKNRLGRWRRIRAVWGWSAAALCTVAGLLAMAWPFKAAIAPTEGPDVSLYSSAAIARGRLVAAAGDCMVCHTAPGGLTNAGGLGLETPFGTIYSTNITPDLETGIGRWSFRAFERALREGVHRDGRQLYPAFPYTAYAKLSDADMQALYAYLMSQPAVHSQPPQTELPFPYKLRPAMAGWNLLFHDNQVYQPDPTRSLEWNRGAYLVQGAGHCSACHSPRNALGAEKTGFSNYLSGGHAEGWSAPALNQLGRGELPWTAEDLYQYLRSGFSARHGVAAGPMAPVIHGLAELPADDVRAIANYLMSLSNSDAEAAHVQPPTATAQTTDAAVQPVQASIRNADRTEALVAPIYPAHIGGERIYQNACAVCHEAGTGPTLFGVKPMLDVNANLHSATPDNLVQVILNGIQAPAQDELGFMPGFKDSLSDSQIIELLGYLRSRFAPQQPAWTVDEVALQRMKTQSHGQP